MRPVHPRNLRVATRGTTREINREVVLNLIRINQPISRADLARLMGTGRGAVSVLVNQLIEDGAVFEGATGEAKRGRKPTFLYMESRQRCVVAVDIRPTRTFVMVTDLLGRQLASVTSYPTERDPKRFVTGLAKRINAILAGHDDLGRCRRRRVVPGMVDAERPECSAPNLGWRDLACGCDRDGGSPASRDREFRQGVRAGTALVNPRRRRVSSSCTNVSDGPARRGARRPTRARPPQHHGSSATSA